MHKHVNTKVVPLTHEFAKHFSRLPNVKGDRDREKPAGRARIGWLYRLLCDGKFHTPKWATAECSGMKYRVNGGHSSLMLAELSNGGFPTGMNAVVDEFVCDTRDDLADLFDQFDNRASLRTSSDKVNAHKGVHDALDSVSATDTKNCINGVALYMSGFEKGNKLDEDERIGLIHTHGGFVLWASPFVRVRALRRVGVVAAMYATYQVDPVEAEKFWRLVKEENHPDNKNPTRKLAVYLRESIARPQFATAATKWKREPRAFFVKSIHAWNAWRDDRTTDLKYHPNAPLPTPH